MRVAFLGVDEVRELDTVLDEEHRGVIADQVPVAFLSVETHCEATRIALGVGAATLAANGGKAHKGFGLLADSREQLGLGVFADVVGDGEGAVSAGAFGMHDALRDALAVEMLELFNQVEVLQQDGATRAGSQ